MRKEEHTAASDGSSKVRKTWTRARGLFMGAIALFIIASLIWHTGGGSLSALGISSIAAVCPLGIVEAAVSGRGIAVHSVVLLVAVVVLTFVFGKAFCSWACPTKLIQGFFHGGKHKKEQGYATEHADGKDAVGKAATDDCSVSIPQCGDMPACAGCAKALEKVGGKRDGFRLDGRHVVLGGTILSAAVFGFPVFCLVCPVGLTIATFIGLWHLFQFNETTWGLLLFPAVLVLELVVFRKWCTTLCPISALLSLIASKNRTFKPEVDEGKCLRSQGVDCRVCVTVCPEEVDPQTLSIPECSKCGKCIEQCPAQAISMKALARSASSERKRARTVSE